MMRRRLVLTACCSFVLALAGGGQAHAFLYWNPHTGSEIGRANLDGTAADEGFVSGLSSGVTSIAIDAGHVYWSNRFTGSIGRANLDGTGVVPNFIAGAGEPGYEGTNALVAIAISGGRIYWIRNGDFVETGPSIGRANLDGTGVEQGLVRDVNARSLAVDADHVYWGGYSNIGRANLDGSGADDAFIQAEFGLKDGIAVDADHIYWADSYTNTVGRANLDGTDITPSFVTPGGSHPLIAGVAVDGEHLYWTDANGGGRIGRANLDGTDVNPSFVPVARDAQTIAVDVGVPRSTSTSVTCVPATVDVGTPTTCTTTVTDTAPGTPSSPPGTVTAGSFTCTLTPVTATGSSCAFTYTPGNPASAPRTDLVTSEYAPSDKVHTMSFGRFTITVTKPDATPPTSSITRGPFAPDGANGWYVSPVHLTVAAADPGGSVAATRCVLDPPAAPASYDAMPEGCAFTGSGADVTADGEHVLYAASIDAAGNKETPVSTSFRIDRTPPAGTLTTPADGAKYSWLGTLLKPVKTSYTCDDGGSGLASCTGTQPSGATLQTGLNALGAHPFTVTATDAAGNTTAVTHTYTVTL